MFDLNINGGDYYESMEHAGDHPDWNNSGFDYDPLFYHRELCNAKVLRETTKAKLVRWQQGANTIEHWLPKSILKSCGTGLHAHTKTLYKILYPKRG